MIAEILGFIASPVVGGLFGFVASHFAKVEDRKVMMIQNQFKLDSAKLAASHRREELTLQGDIAQQTLDGEAFVASQKYGNQNSGNEYMDGIRSMIRPLITTYLLGAVTYFTYHVHTIVNGLDALPVADLVIMYREIIISMLALTNMAVSYWFGSRGTSVSNRNK